MGNRRVSLHFYHGGVTYERIFGPRRHPRYQKNREISPSMNPGLNIVQSPSFVVASCICVVICLSHVRSGWTTQITIADALRF